MSFKDVLGRLTEKRSDQRPYQTDEVAPLAFTVAVRCHKGKVREENQDRAATFSTPIGTLLIVADGVGGLSSGALAAQMTIDGFGKYLGSANPQDDPEAILQQATQAVNETIARQIDTAQQAMASTVALALLRGTTAHIGHAGDSRVFLIRNTEMSRLTRDHSVVQKMVDHGIISDAQSRSHPDASVLTRSLGQKGLELEISTAELIGGDALLLCSDGLWGYVEEEAIHDIACSSTLNAEQRADALLDLALQAGGADNISIIFLLLPGAE